jgi:hypothetical protein
MLNVRRLSTRMTSSSERAVQRAARCFIPARGSSAHTASADACTAPIDVPETTSIGSGCPISRATRSKM